MAKFTLLANDQPMKLQQLKYLLAIVENNFNITTAAEKIYTSQPGVSKQLKLLEEELNLRIFQRSGKQLAGLTATGEQVVEHARRAIHAVENIKRLSEDKNRVEHGQFRLATTQTQAKYVLPTVLGRFHKKYQCITIDLQQASIEHLTQLLISQKVDFAIASDNQSMHPDIIKIPCYEWDRVVLFPQDHPLGDCKKITLQDVAKYPIVTYKEPSAGSSGLVTAMNKVGLEPKLVFTARDADVIKTYVKEGLGVGIIAEMAFDPEADKKLISYSTRDLLPRCTTWIAFNKNLLIRNFMLDFVELFAPHLDRDIMTQYLSNSKLTRVSSDTDSTKSFKCDSLQPKESRLPLHEMWHI